MSVVIPAFDRPDYLRSAIESVLNQSFDNLELIVSDDASPRPLGPTVHGFCDPRVHYIRNGATLGVNGNTRVAIAQARGKYLVVLNDDDLWGPVFLEHMVPYLELDDEVVVAFCNFYIIDTYGNIDMASTQDTTKHFGRDSLRPGKHHPIVRMTLVDGNIPAVMCALFRRDAIEWSTLPEEAESSYDLWMAYMACMTSLAAYYDPAYLTFYRTHDGQQSRTRALAHHLGRAYCYEQFLADPRLTEYRQSFRTVLASEYAGCGTLLLRSGDREGARAKLLQSLRLDARPRSIMGYSLSLLPISAARTATSWAAQAKSALGATARSFASRSPQSRGTAK